MKPLAGEHGFPAYFLTWIMSTSSGVRRTPGTLQSTDQIFGRAVGAGTVGVSSLCRMVWPEVIRWVCYPDREPS